MLEITGLKYSYKKASIPILDDIGFSLEAGSILGLLGVNGAGKSTLVSLVMGLLSPQQGRIIVAGQPVAVGRRDIGFVPQDYAFYEKLTVSENIDFFAAVQGFFSRIERKAAIERVVQDCHLTEFMQRRAGQCSGGEKRRLNLAISLLGSPRLLILDEPTANVDPHARAAIIAIVRTLNEQGMTIIYTSHLLNEVQQLCDSLVLLHEGKVLKKGGMDAFCSPSVRRLVVTMAQCDEHALKTLTQGVPQPVDIIRGRHQCELHFDLGATTHSIVELLHLVERAGINVQAVDTRSDSLGTLFLSLTKSGGALA